MKKLLPLVVFICAAQAAFSQNWCPPGATWYYRVGNDGHIKLQVTGTVTINNITCQDLNGVYTGNSVAGNTVTQGYPVNIKAYANNNVIYRYNPVTLAFDTVVNFNAAIGDKWLTIPYTNTCSSTARMPLTVADTGHVTINNISLKRLKLTVPTGPAPGTFTVIVIERIMNTTGYFYPANYCVLDQSNNFGLFACYSDDNFPSYNPSADVCDYVPTTGIRKNESSNISLNIYPNPNKGNFTLELSEAAGVEIFNSLGARVYNKNFETPGKSLIDVALLSPGIYYISTASAQGRAYSRFIKQ